MKNGENPEVCRSLTIKGAPCKNPGTVPLGDGTHLCSAHASAALRASERPDPVKPRAVPSPVKSRPLADLGSVPATPAPERSERTAPASGPFSERTIRRQIRRIERRDDKRAERMRSISDAVARELGLHRNSSAADLAPAYAEAERRFLNGGPRSLRVEPARDYPIPEPERFRLEVNGGGGSILYQDHASAALAARELSALRGPGGEGFSHGIVYVNRERADGRTFPAGAYARGRRAA